MSDIRQQRGHTGEDAAVRFLEASGFRVCERNWRPGQKTQPGGREQNDGGSRGEVDCIAWQGKTLCFIEVKTRSSNDRGAPREAVNFTKQRQISRLANLYVSFNKLHDVPCRFDVVEVWLNGTDSPHIELHTNAFDYVDPSYGARQTSRSRQSRF